MDLFDPDTTTLNELMERHPAALPILRSHGLDCCCGGALPVGEAASRHGVDLEGLTQALRTAIPAGPRETAG